MTNGQPSARIQVPEICERLQLGRRAVYALLEAHIIPNLRLGTRYVIGRSAYEEWERHFGEKPSGKRDATALQ
jgi:excisionase family DNA binding protein